jgi:predicted nucleotidyltransferase
MLQYMNYKSSPNNNKKRVEDHLASLKLRDRDAVLTREGLIFRVYGYWHAPKAYICDVEYAPASIFRSEDPRAIRQKEKQIYYKFYQDQGLQFVRENYPQYTVRHAPLLTSLVGVNSNQITETRKPDKTFQKLLATQPRDNLLQALQTLSDLIFERTGLSEKNFGVFGSILHGFYHPQFSDLDFIIYGGEKLRRLREILETLYKERSSHLRNEFKTEEAVKEKAKRWKFVNYSPKEYCWHQRRKTIYAVFQDDKQCRLIKTEFEPIKEWSEIHNEYNSKTRILRKGWIKAITRIIDDCDAPFMPSLYQVEINRILEGLKTDDIKRIVSYVEEFRMQAERDEEVYVEGNLEEVVTPAKTFHQITLTYGPRYYEQVLKVARLPS